MPKRMTPEERSESVRTRFFWYTKNIGAGSNECWLWDGAKHPKGYGRMIIPSKGGMDRPKPTHRISWELHYGPIPPKMHVLHRCDCPGCVNPAHLFLGTNADNVADRHSKGRSGDHRGMRQGSRARLNDDLVRIIRASPVPTKELARQLGVCPATISHCRTRRSWSHVP